MGEVMTTYSDDGDVRLFHGDALEVLRHLPSESVDCCVTSPPLPYWGLRDYGCDGQIGLESSPDEWVGRLVAVFAECRRVLAPHGTVWLNVGDAYAASGGAGKQGATGQRATRSHTADGSLKSRVPAGVKPKDLLGLPWLLAFALRADGWWLRSEVIWAKPNPMPESVRDRPTKAHEQVFLLTKQPSYWYDAEALREPATDVGRENGRDGRIEPTGARPPGTTARTLARLDYSGRGRNARSVWSIATESFPGEHFATCPTELVRRCIASGCPERVCRECGTPSERVVDVAYENPGNRTTNGPRSMERRHVTAGFAQRLERVVTVGGWTSCGHDAWRPGVVVDPFVGSGTTALVARRLGLHAIGAELNETYLEIACRRLRQLSLLASTIEVAS